MSEEEFLIPVIIPTYDPTNDINGIPNYNLINDPNYDTSNHFEILKQIKQLLINETSGESSNFMRASGDHFNISFCINIWNNTYICKLFASNY